MTTASPPAARTRRVGPLLAAAAIGAAMSITLGVYGRVHTPTGDPIVTFGFPAVLPMKAWFASIAFALALGQGTTAAWMWGKLPGAGSAPPWAAPLHRWLGTLAFLFTLPVAYHCLWSLGFQTSSPRVIAHSLFGTLFYGAFTTKLLVLRAHGLPGWALPIVGGTLVTLLVGLWLTSSLWFFITVGYPGV